MIGKTLRKLVIGTPTDNDGPNPTPWVHTPLIEIAPGTRVKVVVQEGAELVMEGPPPKQPTL